MSDPGSALAPIAAAPPDLPADVVAAAVRAHFGLEGRIAPLVSERDQNFALQTENGGRVVVKIISAHESATTTDFLVGALEHLERRGGPAAPRIVHALDGRSTARLEAEAGTFRLRVVTWVDGEQLGSLDLDRRLARRFGAALARLDRALQGYTHRGENTVLLWDVQRVAELRPLFDTIDEPSTRRAVAAVVDDFEARVADALRGLRRQVIHGDANPDNVLFSDRGFGFIDFSDSVRAPLVCEAAIAASYLRVQRGDPLRLIAPFIAGYHGQLPLDPREKALLFDLVRARLATTVTLQYWRASARPADDAYRRRLDEVESDAARFLAALDRLGRTEFSSRIS